MPSAIDPTKPTAVTATTASVRDNFAAAKSEIEELQAATANRRGATLSPLVPHYPAWDHLPRATAAAPTTVVVTTNRIYYQPLIIARPRHLWTVGVDIATAVTGYARMALYSSIDAGDGDKPADKLLQVSSDINTGATGIGSKSLDYDLLPDTVYWLALVCSAAAQLRGLAAADVLSTLGRIEGATSQITAYYGTPGSYTLPTTADTPLFLATNPPLFLVTVSA